MFQSAITCRDYQKFIDVCKESREEAEKLLCRYTNTDQELLNDVILSIWEGKTMPHIPFNEGECALQEAIIRGDYRDVLDQGHHITGHF